MPPAATAVVVPESLTRKRGIVGTLVVLALIALAGSVHVLDHSLGTWAFALLAAGSIAVMSRRTIAIGMLVMSGEFVPLLVAVTVVPDLAPLTALAVVFARDPSYLVKILNVSTIAISTVAGITAIHMLDGAGSVILTAAATAAFLAVNGMLVGAWLITVEGVRPREFAIAAVMSLIATGTLLVPVVAVVTEISERQGLVAAPFVLIPVLLAQYFLAMYHRKMQLTGELAEKAQMLARTNLQFAAAMVKALDARDSYTAGHSAAVAVYTRDIAREMGFDDEIVRVAHLAGLLHDIGKIGVPGRVLNKTAPLDDEEYELMKAHAAMGAEILSEVDLYSEIALIIRYHHERIDGRGYPDQLAGEAIPAISRMISVADTYSAMTTDRPYRDGMPTDKAMSILKECRGSQLDSDFTDAFLRILVIADPDYQRGKQTDFEVEVAKHQALSQVEAEVVRVNAPAGPEPAVQPGTLIPVETPYGDVIELVLEREAA